MRRTCSNIDGGLPGGFMRLEYLESTGTQYIDTNYKPNNLTYFYLDFQSRNATKGSNDLSGARWSGADTYSTYAITDGSSSTWQYNLFYGRYDLNHWTSLGTNSQDFLIQRHTAYIDGVNRVCSLDNTFAQISDETYQSTYNFCLFGFNNMGNVAKGYYRIYEAILKENNVDIRHFIPALRLSDNKPGLYDLVGKVFYTNAGTGEFIYNVIDYPLPFGFTKVQYIQSTGTQYIDTGYPFQYGDYFIFTYRNVFVNGTLATMSTENKGWGAGTSLQLSICCGGRKNTSNTTYAAYVYNGNRALSPSISYSTLTDVLYTETLWIGDITQIFVYNNDIQQMHGATSFSTYNTSSYNSGNNVFLFRDSNSSYPYPGAKKLYRCVFIKNGSIVRDFYPCIRNADNKPGLYDRISNYFFTNSGTGEFSYLIDYTYIDLQYIQSTGTQYIDTGFKPNSLTEIIYDCCQSESYNYNNAQTFFGTSNSVWSDNAFACSTYHNGSYGWGNLGSSGWGSFTVTINADTTFKLNSTGLYKDNSLVQSNTNYTINQCTRNLLFCAANYNTITEYGKHRIYSAQIYDNGVLAKNFVPKLRNDGKPGLYDTVNNVFYTNAGTGEFLYKIKATLPDGYTSLNYIQSSGTQWINTLDQIMGTDKILMVFTPKNDSGNYCLYGGANANAYNTGEYACFHYDHKIQLVTPTSNSASVIDNYDDIYYTDTRIKLFIDLSLWDVNETQKIKQSLYGSYICQKTLYIFATNRNNQAVVPSSIQLESFIWYRNNYVLHNYVPALRTPDSKPGLYDTVNNVFYTNAGTGEFLYG